MAVLKKQLQRYVLSVLLIGCVLIGISYRSKNDEARKYEEIIASLRKQISTMQTEIDTLKTGLQQDWGKTVSKSSMKLAPEVTKRVFIDPNTNEDYKPEIFDSALKNAITKMIEKEASIQASEVILSLREENERLINELNNIKALLDTKDLQLLGKEFRETVVDVQSRIVLSTEWQTKQNPVHKINFLESLADLSMERDPEILPILRQALEDPDPEVCLEASKLLKEYRSPEVLPVIETALLSSNEEVRLNALEPLSEIEDPQVSDLLSTPLNDSSEAVRNEALEVINWQKGDIQLNSLSIAMISEYDDVKKEALSLLEVRGDHKSVPVIMAGLNDPNPEYCEEVNSALSFLVDQEFNSYDEAMAWWDSNKERYDEDLFEK